MTELQAMPMFWSTFFADTEHMTEDAAKAHLFLLGHAWLRGARLPDDDGVLSRLCRIGPRKWAAIKKSVLELWQLDENGFWTQKRMSKEFDFVRRRVESNRENGSRGGRPKSVGKDNKINENIKPNGFSIETQKNPPTPTPTPTPIIEDHPPSAAHERISPKSKFEAECRRLVGEEPVLLAHDFHELAAEGFSEADVFEGIRAAMAKQDFRLRHWKQLIGWARRAGQDRLEGEKKPIANGARASPRKLSGQERDAQFYAECMRPDNDEQPDKFEGATIDLEPVAPGVFGSDRHAAQRR